MPKPPIVTVQQYILSQQHERYPQASGDFTRLLSGVTLATKIVAAQVRRAGLGDVVGATGATNIQGEDVQKLDVLANNALLHSLGSRGIVGIVASEEDENAIVLLKDPSRGKYVVIVDPLDGSSNIDVNISVGTIFSILRRDRKASPDRDPDIDVLQPGFKQVAAGYVLYSASTMLIYSTGHGVHGFTLDPSIGAFILSHENMRMPDRGPYYSINEANIDTFPGQYRDYLGTLRSEGYSSRYVGSLVADFHRTLIKGGVFLYPPTQKYPEGKLRLMYEANPIAYLAEQAGGQATDGTGRVLDIPPRELHQRTALVVGGRFEMELLNRCAAQRSL